MLHWLLPEDCRVCGIAIRGSSRVPVCPGCLRAPTPFLPDHFCLSCRTPFLNRHALDEQGQCGLCRRGLRGFQGGYSYGEYGAELRRLIHLFKYEGITPLARPLGAMLATALPRDERIDAIVPVPLHWRKRWRRGFNQSDLLARELSRRTGLPVRPLLRRHRATAVQAGLTHAARRRNVTAAFAVQPGVAVAGQRLLLVDDVLTTGATLSSCADALSKAGVARVTVLTLARADRRTGGDFWREPPDEGALG